MAPLRPKSATKSKPDAEACVKHLSPAQRDTLPNAVWEYLLATIGSEGEIHRMKPQKLRNAAQDFLEAREGLSFWPRSEQFHQWSFSVSVEDVQEYLYRVMSKERDNRNGLFSVDNLIKPKPKSPAKIKATAQPPKDAGSAKRGPSVPKSPVASGDDDRHREKSPTVLPDIPYQAGPITPRSVLPKLHRPRAGGLSVSVDEASSAAWSSPDKTPVKAASNSTALFPRPHNPPSRGPKRPADDRSGTISLTPTSLSPPGRPTKKLDMGKEKAAPRADVEAGLSDAAMAAAAIAAVTDADASSSPSSALPTASALPATTLLASPPSNADTNSALLVEAFGYVFKPQDLATLLEQLSSYFLECQNECIRSAGKCSTEASQQAFRTRATCFANMELDLRSRVQSVAQAFGGKEMAVSSHCLWSLSRGG